MRRYFVGILEGGRYTGTFNVGPPDLLFCKPTNIKGAFFTRGITRRVNVRFVGIMPSSLTSSCVRKARTGVNRLFQRTRRGTPALLFFSRFSYVIPREDGGSSGGRGKRIGRFLYVLGGTTSGSVCIVTTAGRPRQVSGTILQANEVSRLVCISVPSAGTERDLFGLSLNGLPVRGSVGCSLLTRGAGKFGYDSVNCVIRMTSEGVFGTDVGGGKGTFGTVARRRLLGIVSGEDPSIDDGSVERFSQVGVRLSEKRRKRRPEDVKFRWQEVAVGGGVHVGRGMLGTLGRLKFGLRRIRSFNCVFRCRNARCLCTPGVVNRRFLGVYVPNIYSLRRTGRAFSLYRLTGGLDCRLGCIGTCIGRRHL